MSEESPLRANERLREARLQRGWSQQKLADELGIAVVTVNRWERGKQQPATFYRLKLSTLFDKSVEELGLVEEETEPVSPIEIQRDNIDKVLYTSPNEHEDPSLVPDPILHRPLLEKERSPRSFPFFYNLSNQSRQDKKKRTLLLLLSVLILLLVALPIIFFFVHSIETSKNQVTLSTKKHGISGPTPYLPEAFTPPPTWKHSWFDPMTLAHHDDLWSIQTEQDAKCGFNPKYPNGYYAYSKGPNYCNYSTHISNNFSEMAYSVDITLYKGSMGGLIFRLHSKNSNEGNYYYGFYITTAGQYLILWHTDDGGGDDKYLTNLETSPMIHQGLNQTNILSVIAQGTRFTFWINGKYVTTVTDATYSSGTIGVYIGNPSDASTITEALFNNAHIWTP